MNRVGVSSIEMVIIRVSVCNNCGFRIFVLSVKLNNMKVNFLV